MDPQVSEWLNLIFRWVHVVAGVLWIGHLYFFNFVNAQVAKTYDADSKKKVVPELMPRALYWFRMGAAWTWATGFLLLGIIYYMGNNLVRPESGLGNGAGVGIAIALLILGFVIYDVMWKALEKKEQVGVIVSFVLVAVLCFAMYQLFDKRAAYIHLGAIFGTIMAANVWMRIWPAQRRIIGAIKGGTAPDPGDVARAGLRSKHNTYMSVPLIFTMISNHFPGTYGHDYGWAILIALTAIGWAATKFLYGRSASPSPARF